MCDGDKSKRDGIMCNCNERGAVFDHEGKECKVKEGTQNYYSLKNCIIFTPFFYRKNEIN